MAPELLNAAPGEYPASFASDVYSLGVTTGWIVLKGIHPFNPQKIVQSVLMINGMAPPNLQNLSWDLQDLILKLTDKDPEKRPNMSLVLRHPYFILTNDRTKWQFVDELWEYFDSLQPKEQEKTVNEIFNAYNFHEWYNTLSGYSTPNAEDNKIMINIQQLLANFSLKNIIYNNRKDYEHKLKEAIKPEYDLNIGSKINQVLFHQFSYDVNLSSHRLYQLIKYAPKLVSLYIWSQLVKIFSGQDYRQHVKIEPNNGRNNNKKLRGRRPNNSKLTKSHQIAKYQLTYTKSELEWISLFCDQEEHVDELWMIKYGSEQYGTDRVMEVMEMLDSFAKCNVTERIWMLLLDELNFVDPLLHASAMSHFSIAPKMTELVLKKGSWEEVKGSRIPSPLHLAACNRSQYGVDIMRVLLDNGGDPNSVDRQGFTPLHAAARNESESAPRIVKLLLEKSANPNAVFGPNALTPLHYAGWNEGDYAHEIMRELLNHGGSYDAMTVKSNVQMFRPIHLAMTNRGNSALQLVNLFIENGQDVNTISGLNGWMPIHFTVINRTCNGNGVNILKKLLENEASPNASDYLGRTPLHLAVFMETEQAIEMLKILLENGANPNAVDNNVQTPVHFAAQNKGERAAEKLQILLTNGGNPLVKDKYQLTPFHYAAFNTGACGYQIRKILPINQEDINKPIDTNGTTLLHLIVQCFDDDNIRIDHVQLVLDNGGDPNAKNNIRLSSLHVAVIKDYPAALSLLQLLIQKGGCPNLPHSKTLRTPVHFAALSKEERAPEKLRLLLENGGDPNAKDIYQRTPLHLALTNDANGRIRLDIVAELLKQGGNPNSKDCDGETPVHYVVMENRTNSLEMIKLLVENGGDVNAPNIENVTPLNIVEQHGYRSYCSPQVKRYIQKASRKKK